MHNNEISDDAFQNMRNFVNASNFKKTTLMYLASRLPEKYFDDLRRTFIMIDENGDGKIEEKEFHSALIKVGAEFDKSEVKELMDALDTN